MAKQRNYEAEEAALRKDLSGERWRAVYALCGLEEAWARDVAGAAAGGGIAAAMRAAAKTLEAARAQEAAAHLERAEKWQTEIASYATSGAEGLMFVGELHEFRLARAWLLIATKGVAGQRLARKLCATVEGDPNGVPASLRSQLKALRAKLD